MSVRSTSKRVGATHAEKLRTDIDTFRTATVAAAAVEHDITFDSLTETEKSAALIGVNPDDWKPIAFMNDAHYTTLLKKNALGGRLTQQIIVKSAYSWHGLLLLHTRLKVNSRLFATCSTISGSRSRRSSTSPRSDCTERRMCSCRLKFERIACGSYLLFFK